MEALPLQKVRNIMDYWMEITLPMEEREKRMREKADKAAQEVFEQIITGKVNIETPTGDNADPGTLDRFMGLGLDPAMLGLDLTKQEGN